MSRLPVCSGSDAVKAFGKIGYAVDHQTWSHIILRHSSGRRLTIPNHRELAKGTLRTFNPGSWLNERAIWRFTLTSGLFLVGQQEYHKRLTMQESCGYGLEFALVLQSTPTALASLSAYPRHLS